MTPTALSVIGIVTLFFVCVLLAISAFLLFNYLEMGEKSIVNKFLKKLFRKKRNRHKKNRDNHTKGDILPLKIKDSGKFSHSEKLGQIAHY